MLFFTLLLSLYATVALAAWGYTDNGNYYTIDTGSKLVVQVSKTNGDIQSMKYNVSKASQSLTMLDVLGGGGGRREWKADLCKWRVVTFQ